MTEEEIQTYYQKNIDKFQGKDGIQPLNDVKEKAKADALRQKAAKQSLRTGCRHALQEHQVR